MAWHTSTTNSTQTRTRTIVKWLLDRRSIAVLTGNGGQWYSSGTKKSLCLHRLENKGNLNTPFVLPFPTSESIQPMDVDESDLDSRLFSFHSLLRRTKASDRPYLDLAVCPRHETHDWLFCCNNQHEETDLRNSSPWNAFTPCEGNPSYRILPISRTRISIQLVSQILVVSAWWWSINLDLVHQWYEKAVHFQSVRPDQIDKTRFEDFRLPRHSIFIHNRSSTKMNTFGVASSVSPF